MDTFTLFPLLIYHESWKRVSTSPYRYRSTSWDSHSNTASSTLQHSVKELSRIGNDDTQITRLEARSFMAEKKKKRSTPSATLNLLLNNPTTGRGDFDLCDLLELCLISLVHIDDITTHCMGYSFPHCAVCLNSSSIDPGEVQVPTARHFRCH